MSEGLGLLVRPWVKKYVAGIALNGVPVNYPKIDPSTHHWLIFDPTSGTYVDSGVLAQGTDGVDGIDGKDGTNGIDGKSAYDIWLDAGNIGSEADFLVSLIGVPGSNGVDGKSAYDIWIDAGNTGSAIDFLDSLKGADGKSAYQTWLDVGNVGTEQDFLNSLVGSGGGTGGIPEAPADGKQYARQNQSWQEVAVGRQFNWRGKYQLGNMYNTGDVVMGNDGNDYIAATDGLVLPPPSPGWDDFVIVSNGKSAYDLWLDAGNTGSEQDFLDSLVGTDGKSAYDVWLDAGNTGSMLDFLNSLVGAKGADGKSAYQVWLDAGNTGTEQDFLDSLASGPGSSTGCGPSGFFTLHVEPNGDLYALVADDGVNPFRLEPNGDLYYDIV